MNTLKINGTTLTGIYVDAAVSYNKPAKRVQTFEVPGRNGNLIIDEGTFDNVMITYPVYEKSTFPAEFDDLVNRLASLEGYQRIECSNDPGHYRLGRFVVPQTPTVKRLNRDGYYQLSFDCKPQRWLLSGEEDTEIDANPQETYSGDVLTFNATPLDEISNLELAVTPVQSGTGDPSPSNIRPISGWTGATLNRTGKNRCAGFASSNTTDYDINFKFVEDVAGEITNHIQITGTSTAPNASTSHKYLGGSSANIKSILFKANTTYTLSLYGVSGTTPNIRIGLFGSDNTTRAYLDSTNGKWVYTPTEDTEVGRIMFRVTASGSVVNIDGYFQIEVGETATAYEPYNSAAYAFDWTSAAGTVYRGTLDVMTGVLTLTHQMIDMGAINWVYQSSYAYFWPFSATYETPSTDMLSSAYKVFDTEKSSTQMGSAANYTIAKALGDTIVMVKNTDYTDASAFKTAMSGVQLLIPLATPIEYILTSQEVALLTGVNNIWGDTGDVSMTVITPTNFINPSTFASKPIIRVYGAGTFRVGDIYITISSHTQPYIDIDCEMQDCYYGATNMNAYVAFSGGEYPELVPGNNYVLLGTGITKLEVTPRWWEL